MMRRELIWRVLFFGALWAVWAGDKPGSWGFGAPAVVIATLMAMRAGSEASQGLRVGSSLRFLLYFARASLQGGVDVAWRAMSPRMRLRPGFIEYPLELEASSASAVFFANIISLLPGTLSVRLGERSVMVHAIDLAEPVEAQLRELEGYVGAMFGQKPGGGA